MSSAQDAALLDSLLDSKVAKIDAIYQLETDRFGMWVFIAMETLFFGGALFLYWGERHFYREAFAIGSSHLELTLATFNTAVLMTSSLTMAFAVHCIEKARRRSAANLLVATAALGLLFLALKGYEYRLDAQKGLLPGFAFQPSFPAPKEIVLFFSIYLFATALHAVHLTIGVAWCSWAAIHASRKELTSGSIPSLARRIDVLGLYWHFIDIIWVFLFPLFYLIGGTR